MDDSLLREIVTRHASGERFAVAILAHVQGSAPQKAGARLLVLPDGRMSGTVGGGCLEMETRRRALIALRTGEPELFTLRLDDDFGWDDGLICGGRTTLLVSPHPERCIPAIAEALAARDAGNRAIVTTVVSAPSPGQVGTAFCLPEEGGDSAGLPFPVAPPDSERPVIQEAQGYRVLVESVRPNPRLIVMGCGHIGAALVKYAAELGFDVTAVDDRPEYASAARLPQAKQVICDDLPAAARSLPSGPDTYWVIVTRGHRNDGRVLSEVIVRDSAYAGMIGSRRKVRLIREGLLSNGSATEAQVRRLHSPVGLDIGAETPQEIALAIAAELVKVRRQESPLSASRHEADNGL